MGNNLVGNIPPTLGNLPELTYLDLSVNNLAGGIPPSLGNLLNLDTLALGTDHLSGPIPDELGNLLHLKSLDLSINRYLTGTIPASLGNLVNLIDLYLSSNLLSGSIPASLGNLTKLTHLVLPANQLSGNIPSTLANLTNLSVLDLFGNQLGGNIPAFIPKLPNLSALLLFDNKFTFAGMEKIAAKKSIAFDYTPQANIPVYRQGDDIYVSAGGTLANDTFRLYKNGVLDSVKIGANSFHLSSSGRYSFAVTNAIATKLTLYSDTIDVLSTLPLTLLSFTGALQHGVIPLTWQTAGEINTSRFIVERSSSNLRFVPIGAVNNINTPGTHLYQFTDGNPLAGTGYYRLQMLDKDGHFAYSNTIIIKTQPAVVALSVYPNPVQNKAGVLFNAPAAGKYTITVTSITGKTIYLINGISVAGANKAIINVDKYAKGSYLVTLTSGENSGSSVMLIKE